MQVSLFLGRPSIMNACAWPRKPLLIGLAKSGEVQLLFFKFIAL